MILVRTYFSGRERRTQPHLSPHVQSSDLGRPRLSCFFRWFSGQPRWFDRKRTICPISLLRKRGHQKVRR